MNELQVKILEVSPSVVKFNYEEMKKVAAEIKAEYEGLIFTDETVKEGKKTVAELKKIQKSVNDFKIKTKKDLTQSVTEFEIQCKDIISDFDDPINFISTQLEEFETERIRVKTLQIESTISQLYENLEIESRYQTIEFRSDWLNITKKEKDILAECSYDANECLAKQKQYYQNIELIKTLVELANAKHQLNVHMSDLTFISMMEYKTIDDIKELITSTAEAQAEQEKSYAEKVAREAKEKQEKAEQEALEKAQKEFDRINAEAQKKIDDANKAANEKIETLKAESIRQIDEVVEFANSQIKKEDPVKIYDKTLPKKLFRFEAELTKEQYEGLGVWFKNNGVNAKVMQHEFISENN